MKIKKILVPLDFSENSISALKYASALAVEPGAGIFILHVGDPNTLDHELHQNLNPQHIYELLCKEDYLKNIKTSFSIIDGNVSGLIADHARKIDADLIVMGTQGAGNLKESLIGTNTSTVISNSICPVLAIPKDAVFNQLMKVVVAVDIDKKEEKSILELVEYFKKLDVSILLTYVTDDHVSSNDNVLSKLTEKLKEKSGYQKLSYKLIKSSKFMDGIEDFILNIEADMLVTLTHHRGILESIFDPSVTKKLSIHSTVPIFAVPQQTRPIIFLGVPI